MAISKRIRTAWTAAVSSLGDAPVTGPRHGALALGHVPQSLPAGVSVLVSGTTDIQVLQRTDVIVEHLVPPGAYPERFSEAEVSAYLARRLSVLALKWNLAKMTALDPVSAAVVAEWQRLDPQSVPEIALALASGSPSGQSAHGTGTSGNGG